MFPLKIHTKAHTLLTSSKQTKIQWARNYGGLKDKDRIFTNLYGEHDFGLEGALKRVHKDLLWFHK